MPLIVGGNVANTTTVLHQPVAPTITQPPAPQGLTLLQVKLEAMGAQVERVEKDTFVGPSYKRPISSALPRQKINPDDPLVVVDGKAKKMKGKTVRFEFTKSCKGMESAFDYADIFHFQVTKIEIL